MKQRCTICAVREGSGAELAAGQSEYLGRTFYFCRTECKQEFDADPAGWAARFDQVAAREGAHDLGALPQLKLESGDKPLDTAEWKGKVVVVDFWATWCGPCVAEIPEFIALQAKHPETLRVLGVSYDKEAEAHAQFLREKGVNYPSFQSSQPEARAFLRQLVKQVGPVKSIPVTLLVNRHGEIVYRQSGPVDDAFRTALEQELKAK